MCEGDKVYQARTNVQRHGEKVCCFCLRRALLITPEPPSPRKSRPSHVAREMKMATKHIPQLLPLHLTMVPNVDFFYDFQHRKQGTVQGPNSEPRDDCFCSHCSLQSTALGLGFWALFRRINGSLHCGKFLKGFTTKLRQDHWTMWAMI